MSKAYLFGDSIAKGVIYDESRGRYALCRERCTNLLLQSGVDLEPHARMGATIEDGYAAFCETETRPGGVCVIEFGGNDCDIDWAAVAAAPDAPYDARVPLARFTGLLDVFIRDARSRGLQPMLVTPVPLVSDRYFDWVTRGLDSDAVLRALGDREHIYRWQERYAQAVREAAVRNRCPLIDLRRGFLEARRFTDLMCIDGIHPNADGQKLMARIILQSLPDYRRQLGA